MQIWSRGSTISTLSLIRRRLMQSIPYIFRDPILFLVIGGLWTVSAVLYIALHSLIYVGGVTYRWLYAVMFILFLIALFVELVRQAPQRKKLPKMLKAGHVSASLARAVNEIQAFSRESDSKEFRITASLTSSDGNLVASSSTTDSALFEVCQRVSAVAASIALEYRALENIMTYGFRSVFISTDKRLIFCDHFAEMKEAGSILLVLTVDTDSLSDKMVDIGILRALSSRIKEDFLPSISPVLETLILVPPTE